MAIILIGIPPQIEDFSHNNSDIVSLKISPEDIFKSEQLESMINLYSYNKDSNIKLFLTINNQDLDWSHYLAHLKLKDKANISHDVFLGHIIKKDSTSNNPILEHNCYDGHLSFSHLNRNNYNKVSYEQHQNVKVTSLQFLSTGKIKTIPYPTLNKVNNLENSYLYKIYEELLETYGTFKD